MENNICSYCGVVKKCEVYEPDDGPVCEDCVRQKIARRNELEWANSKAV